MSVFRKLGLTTFACTLVIVSSMSLTAIAQSDSRTGTRAPQQAANGSASSQANGSSHHGAEMSVGLHGYCPVCLVEMKQWIKGDARIAHQYDEKTYLFPGAKQAAMFNQDPLKYLPAMGGDDIVHFVRTGRRQRGGLADGLFYGGRAYFFASAENKQLFQSSPKTYANADLALGGECVVCRVNMNQRVAGSPDFAATYKGLRYQFPGKEQRATFLSSPDRYVEAITAMPGQAPAGSGTRPSTAPQQTTSGSGSR